MRRGGGGGGVTHTILGFFAWNSFCEGSAFCLFAVCCLMFVLFVSSCLVSLSVCLSFLSLFLFSLSSRLSPSIFSLSLLSSLGSLHFQFYLCFYYFLKNEDKDKDKVRRPAQSGLAYSTGGFDGMKGMELME